MRKLGIPPEQIQPDRYTGPKINLTPCVEAKRRPTTLDRDYSLLTMWRVDSSPSTGDEGEVWQLVKFTSGDAIWRRIDFSAAGVGIDTITVDDVTAPGVNPVEPTSGGTITIQGSVVAAHSVPIETHSRAINTLNVEVQVASAITGAPANALSAGICSFDDTAFVVDSNGYVTLAGGAGPAADTFGADSGTAVPTGAGLITFTGGTGITTSAASNTVTIDLDSPVSVTNGGTGVGSITAGAIPLGDGTNPINELGPLTDGQVITGISSSDPIAQEMTWLPVNYGYVFNMSWSLSGGILTVAGYDGTALSATNPAYALIKSNANTGQYALLKFTANQTLDENDLDGNLLGTTTGVAWSSSGLPLYVGIMADASDTNPVFVITRIPHLRVSPSSSGDIGDPSAANGDTERSVVAWDDITEADYTSKNLLILGGIAVTKDAADAYTIDTAASSYSGIGDFLEAVTFGFPVGQNGAASGNYVTANGGTAPVFNTTGYQYYLSRNGNLRGQFRFSGDGGTDGSGAVSTQLALPLQVHNFSPADTNPLGTVFVSSASGPTTGTLMYGLNSTNRSLAQFTELSTGNDVQNGDFTNGGRNLWGEFNYYVYQGSS